MNNKTNQDPRWSHPSSQNSANPARIYRCSNGHKYMSRNGLCGTCGMMGSVTYGGDDSGFNKAFSAPTLRK